MAQRILCLLEQIGLLKRLKKASLPSCTALLSPKTSLGHGIILPAIFSRSFLMCIPRFQKVLKCSVLLMSFMSPLISSSLAAGDLMVCYEICLRLNQSNSSGMPVIKQNQGMRRISLESCLFSAFSNGCLGLVIVSSYFFSQYLLMVKPSVPSRISSDILRYTISSILQYLVLPQLAITIFPTSSASTRLRFSYFYLSWWALYTLSIAIRAVWLLTIFLVESTRRQNPFSSRTKLDLQPLNIIKLSKVFRSRWLKYLQLRPIYTQSKFFMIFRRPLLRKCNNSFGHSFIWYTLTCFTLTLYYPAQYQPYFPRGLFIVQMFIPVMTGCSNIHQQVPIKRFMAGKASLSTFAIILRLSASMRGSIFTLKMYKAQKGSNQTRQ